MSKLPLNSRITIDVETDAPPNREIDVMSDPLLCVGFSWHKDFGVVASFDVANNRLFKKGMSDLIKDRPDIRWTFHNGKFDTAVLKHRLFMYYLVVDDTMLMSYICDERGGIHGLKHLSMIYCGADRYEEEILKYAPNKTGMSAVPKPILYKYNAYDCVYTYRLAEILDKRMDDDNVRRPYEEFLIPASNALSEIEAHGVPVDLNYIEQLKEDYLPKIAQSAAIIKLEALKAGFDATEVIKTKDPTLNPGSPKQLAALLYDTLGIPIIRGEGRTTRKEVLDKIFENYPYKVITDLKTYRTMTKMMDTYVYGIEDDIKIDGKVHPDVLLHGTLSGRRSIHNPPLQTIPKKSSIGEAFDDIKSIFIASEGYTFGHADYSIIELWMVYLYSRDQQLYDDLTSGDYHKVAASTMFKIPIEEVTKKLRDDGKTITYGTLYGREANAVSIAMGGTVHEAQIYIDRWFARYPDVVKWRNEVEKTAIDIGELVTITGRKRRFPLITPDTIEKIKKQAVNELPQATTGDVVLSAMIRLQKILKPYDAHILFEVHDSLSFEIPTHLLDELCPLIVREMEMPVLGTDVSVPVDMMTGPNWGNLDTKWSANGRVP